MREYSYRTHAALRKASGDRSTVNFMEGCEIYHGWEWGYLGVGESGWGGNTGEERESLCKGRGIFNKVPLWGESKFLVGKMQPVDIEIPFGEILKL